MRAAVTCAARWNFGVGLIPGGPVVEVDSDYPDRVVIDGDVLRVESWTYVPFHLHTDGTYDCCARVIEPWKSAPALARISARMPMENGAVLLLGWHTGETNEVGLWREEPGGSRPLRETDEALVADHPGCGINCEDPACDLGTVLPIESPGLSADEIVAIWRRLGTKPIGLIDLTVVQTPTEPPPSSVPLSALDKVIRSGRTVTLEQWKAMTGR